MSGNDKSGIKSFLCDAEIREENRGVAQSGSAPALGAGCRRFKSSRPDHNFLWQGVVPPKAGSHRPYFSVARVVPPEEVFNATTEILRSRIAKSDPGVEVSISRPEVAPPRELQKEIVEKIVEIGPAAGQQALVLIDPKRNAFNEFRGLPLLL